MIISRRVEESDRKYIDEGFAHDEFHDKGLTSDVYFPKLLNGEFDPRYVSNTFEDEKGPIFFTQGTKVLKIQASFRDNNDHRRNLKALRAFFAQLRVYARQNGFTALQASTKSPQLAEFLIKHEQFEQMQTVENKEISLESLL